MFEGSKKGARFLSPPDDVGLVRHAPLEATPINKKTMKTARAIHHPALLFCFLRMTPTGLYLAIYFFLFGLDR